MTAIAGFFLAASVVGFVWQAFVGVVCGIAFVIASACVVNNVLDRDIDTRMKRTAKRSVASGHIRRRNALLFAAALGGVGFGLLALLTNGLTLLLGVVAYGWYIVVYGFAKRTTPFSTIIGGVPGALPPLAGYTALTGQLDVAALALFLILFFWQLPHFYAISMFRRDDYAAAGLPVWSVRYGMKSTRRHILIAAICYGLAALLLVFTGYVGVVYAVASTAVSAYWLVTGIRRYRRDSDVIWAKAMFGVSLLVLLTMSGLIAIGGFVA